jgi:hypothetical protein
MNNLPQTANKRLILRLFGLKTNKKCLQASRLASTENKKLMNKTIIKFS